jgi:glycosyltransferase involved in cell wall biosynthesis
MEVLILGCRGIPARHGGFETFAETLSSYLTAQGHGVTVYCQSDTKPEQRVDVWNGVQRVHIYGPPGASGTIKFDLDAVLDSLKRPGVILILGYNTAVFSILYRMVGRPSLMNMDGIEWKRQKWSYLQRLWLRFNEFAGAKLSNHLIADHPAIGKHLLRHVDAEKISVIAYGADSIDLPVTLSQPRPEVLVRLGLSSQRYALVIARPEPENSILEIVEAFSARSRGMKLVVLGDLRPEESEYHRKVMAHASADVIFPGTIYAKPEVEALRQHARVYLHGHRVGGTNPSLVEALAADGAVIAHDNVFTRWVAGPGAAFFRGAEDLTVLLDQLLNDDVRLQAMRASSHQRHLDDFLQSKILSSYEALLMRYSEVDPKHIGTPSTGGHAVPAKVADRRVTISN